MKNFFYLYMLELRQLTLNDESAFLDGLKLFESEDPHWYSFLWHDLQDYKKMLQILHNEHLGVELAPGRVAHTMYYAFLNEKIIGRLSVRHELNDYLRARGGHIGYSIAPKYRRKGYAKEMFRQGLQICHSLKINPVLITCSEENLPSIKLIEHFGGILENTIQDPDNGENVRRYWIKT